MFVLDMEVRCCAMENDELRSRPSLRAMAAMPGCGGQFAEAFAPSVAGALAAIDVQDLAGDEARAFQEQDRVDDVLALSHASDRMQFCKEVVRLRRVHRGLDDAGSNRVDPYALRCVFDRQRLCGGVQSALGQ